MSYKVFKVYKHTNQTELIAVAYNQSAEDAARIIKNATDKELYCYYVMREY